MQPYYQTHPIGVLYLLAVAGWYLMEIAQFVRQRHWQKKTLRIAPRSYWPAFWVAMAVATSMLFLAPRIAPGARIGHPAVAFGLGIFMVIAGVAVRGWSFRTLGRYFTFTVTFSPDQPVVTAGPYRLLRHPGYAGGLLATTGLGLMWGNWVSLATLTLLTLTFIIWRIRTRGKGAPGKVRRPVSRLRLQPQATGPAGLVARAHGHRRGTRHGRPGSGADT